MNKTKNTMKVTFPSRGANEGPCQDTAPTLLQQEPVDIILLDMNFSLGVNSGQEGLLWLRTFRRLHGYLYWLWSWYLYRDNHDYKGRNARKRE